MIAGLAAVGRMLAERERSNDSAQAVTPYRHSGRQTALASRSTNALARSPVLPALLEGLSDLCQAVGLPAYVKPGAPRPKIGASCALEDVNGTRYLSIGLPPSSSTRSQLEGAQAALRKLLGVFGLDSRGNILPPAARGSGWTLSFELGAV